MKVARKTRHQRETFHQESVKKLRGSPLATGSPGTAVVEVVMGPEAEETNSLFAVLFWGTGLPLASTRRV